MKIAYLTSIDTDGHSAASNQVKSMCRAFNEELKDSFVALSVTKNKLNFPYIKGIQLSKIKHIKKLLTPIVYLPFVLKENIKYVYCREIAIAFIYTFIGKRVIFELHELNGRKSQNFLLNILSRFKNFTVVTVSEAGKDKLTKAYRRIRCQALPNGVFLNDYDKLLPNRDALHQQLCTEYNCEYIYIYTGSLYKGRDAEIIFKCAQIDTKITFLIIGGKDSEFKSLHEKFGLLANVKHIPTLAHTDIMKYQVAADALIYPISKENKISAFTSPLKIFEYMAARRPILATRIGAVNELLNDKVCYLFNEDDDSTAIMQLLKKDLEIDVNQKVNVAFKLVQDNYTWGVRVKRILKLFRS